MKHRVSINELKKSLLQESMLDVHSSIYVDYDRDFDALFVRIVPLDIETVVHYISDRIGLLYEADTYEIVGVQIENFMLAVTSVPR